MKGLKKQVVLLLWALACLFAMTACSKTGDVPSLTDAESASLQSDAQVMLERVVEIGDTLGMAAVTQYRDNGLEPMAAGIEAYLSSAGELGAYQSVSGGTAEKNDDGYSITLNAVFEKRPCEFNITVDNRLEQVTSMSFTPVYTTGENMTKAALNTLMGMGTVFIVLIFISWLISCFRYIRMFEDKKNKKKTPAPVPVVTRTAAAPAPAVQEDLTDNLELVAVITAAIAASTGASADGLVVRSIRRAPGSKWKKA